MAEINYVNPKFPVELGFSVAGDVVNTLGKNLGFQVSVSKSFFQTKDHGSQKRGSLPFTR
jgi:hypothetical protein